MAVGQRKPVCTWPMCSLQGFAALAQVLGSVMALVVAGIVCLTWYTVVPATYGPMLVSGNVLKAAGGVIVSIVFTAVVSGHRNASHKCCSSTLPCVTGCSISFGRARRLTCACCLFTPCSAQ